MNRPFPLDQTGCRVCASGRRAGHYGKACKRKAAGTFMALRKFALQRTTEQVRVMKITYFRYSPGSPANFYLETWKSAGMRAQLCTGVQSSEASAVQSLNLLKIQLPKSAIRTHAPGTNQPIVKESCTLITRTLAKS